MSLVEAPIKPGPELLLVDGVIEVKFPQDTGERDQLDAFLSDYEYFVTLYLDEASGIPSDMLRMITSNRDYREQTILIVAGGAIRDHDPHQNKRAAIAIPDPNQPYPLNQEPGAFAIFKQKLKANEPS